MFLDTPNQRAREKILKSILKDIANTIKDADIKTIAKLTEGFSASDLGTVARNAAWLPLGTIAQHLIPTLKIKDVSGTMWLAYFKSYCKHKKVIKNTPSSFI